MTVSTQPLTLRGNTSPPVFLLTLIRGSRLHHTHSFGFAVSTMQKVKEDIWCCRERRERWGQTGRGRKGAGAGERGGRGAEMWRTAAQHGRAQIRMREWIAQDIGWRGGTDRLKHRLNRGGQYAWLLNEEPARLKSKDGGSQGNGGSGGRRRGGEGGCEKCAIVSLSFSPLLLKDESFIAHFISRSSTALPSRRRLSPSLSSRYSGRLNLHLKREGERETERSRALVEGSV